MTDRNVTTLRPVSKITEVTVFESSAQVRRVGRVDAMPKGEVAVVFADLPQSLDRDNVQVAVRHGGDGGAEGGCTLRGVSFKTETIETEIAPAAPSEERAKLADAIKALKRQLEDVEDQAAAAAARGSFVRDCAGSALSGTREEEERGAAFSSPEQWAAMLSATAKADAEALAAKRGFERQTKELRQQLNKTQSELDQRGGGRRVTTRQVVVVALLTAAELKDVDVRISYVVTSASWSPEYDVRFDPEKNEAKVTYNAVVKQTGDEAWPNAILTISTARPTISGKPSDLTPWRASIYVPPPPRPVARDFRSNSSGRRRAGSQTSALEECDGAYLEKCCDALVDTSRYVEPQIETAKVKEGATSMSFHIENHPYTVTNDGKPVRVTLAVVPLQSKVSYIARPKLAETVFARVKATNMSEFTLLPGPALVFSGQQFVSKTALERVAPRGEFTVSLGADNDVTVKYRRLKTERADAGSFLSGKKVKYTLQTRITVKNRKRDAIDITVEDQVPVSGHGDIEVTMVQPPPPEENTAAFERLRSGLVEFQLSIAAGKEQEVPIELTVKHPEGFDMAGL